MSNDTKSFRDSNADCRATAADYARLRAAWGSHDWLPDFYRNAICEHIGITRERFGAFLQDMARLGLSIKIAQCGAHSDFLGMTCVLPKGHTDPWHMTYEQIEAELLKREMQPDRRFEIAGKPVPND